MTDRTEPSPPSNSDPETSPRPGTSSCSPLALTSQPSSSQFSRRQHGPPPPRPIPPRPDERPSPPAPSRPDPPVMMYASPKLRSSATPWVVTPATPTPAPSAAVTAVLSPRDDPRVAAVASSSESQGNRDGVSHRVAGSAGGAVIPTSPPALVRSFTSDCFCRPTSGHSYQSEPDLRAGGAMSRRDTLRGSGCNPLGSHRHAPALSLNASIGAAAAQDVTSVATSPTSASASAAQEQQQQKLVLNDEGQVVAATPEALVERMTTEEFADTTFMNHFLLTHHAHTPPTTLLQLLVQRYNAPPPQSETQEESLRKQTAQRLRVFVILKTWVEKLWNSSTNPELIVQLNAFSAEAQAAFPKPVEQLLRVVARSVSGEESKREVMFSHDPDLPLVPLCLSAGCAPPPPSPALLLQIHPKEIARQMTVVEHELFRAIKPWELQDQAWTKALSLAPNVRAYTARSVQVSQWIASMLLSESCPVRRTALLESALEIADHACELQNFLTVFEVMSALAQQPVFRLNLVKNISERHQQVYQALSALVDSHNSFSAIRARVRTLHPPCVPFLGVHQSDLTKIGEGIVSMKGGLINFSKYRKQALIITDVLTLQQAPYCLDVVPWIRDWLSAPSPCLDEKQLWELSHKIEPEKRRLDSHATSSPTNVPGSAPPQVGSPPAVPALNFEGISPDTTAPASSSPHGNMTISIVPLGCAAPLTLTVTGEATTEDLKREAVKVMATLQAKGCPCGSPWDATLPVAKLSLVSTGTRSFPLGVILADQPLKDLPESSRQALLALYAKPDVVDVVLLIAPAKAQSAVDAVMISTFLDVSSALHSASVILESIFRVGEEFVYLRLDRGPTVAGPRWINSNRSLEEQGFDPRQHRLVLIPLSRLVKPAGDVAIKDRTLFPANSSAPDKSCRLFASLSKAGLRSMSRPGILRGGLGGGMGSGLGPLSSSTLTLGGGGGSDRCWFMAADSFLFYYKGTESPSPKRVWALDYSRITLGLTHSTVPCVVLRPIPNHPFKKSAQPPSVLIYHPLSETVTRNWFTALSKKSGWSNTTRVFGVSLHELVSRNPESPVPAFVTYVVDLLYHRALAFPQLFSGSVSGSVLEKAKDGFDQGAEQPAEDQACDTPEKCQLLGLLLLMWLAELPEPLVPYLLAPNLASYYRAHCQNSSSSPAAELDVESLRALLLPGGKGIATTGIPQPNAAVLHYLIAFFRLWAQESKTGIAKAAALVGPLIIRAKEDDLHGQPSPEVATKIMEDMLAQYPRVTMTPGSWTPSALARRTCSFSSVEPLPVSILSKDELRVITLVADSARQLDQQGDISPPPAISPSQQPPISPTSEECNSPVVVSSHSPPSASPTISIPQNSQLHPLHQSTASGSVVGVHRKGGVNTPGAATPPISASPIAGGRPPPAEAEGSPLSSSVGLSTSSAPTSSPSSVVECSLVTQHEGHSGSPRTSSGASTAAAAQNALNTSTSPPPPGVGVTRSRKRSIFHFGRKISTHDMGAQLSVSVTGVTANTSLEAPSPPLVSPTSPAIDVSDEALFSPDRALSPPTGIASSSSASSCAASASPPQPPGTLRKDRSLGARLATVFRSGHSNSNGDSTQNLTSSTCGGASPAPSSAPSTLVKTQPPTHP